MKKIIICLLLNLALVSIPIKSFAQDNGGMDPKLKTFLIVTAYGTTLGALLGFASLAFESNGRAVSQGASLGLYAGMLFGGYILYTHNLKNNPPPPGTYQDAITPYQGNPTDSPYESGGGGFFDGGIFGGGEERRIQMPQESSFSGMNQFSNKTSSSLPVYMELMRLKF